MAWTHDQDSTALSESMNDYARNTTGLDARNVLLQGRRVRTRRRLGAGAGLVLGTVLIAGFGAVAVTGSSVEQSTVQPVTAPTPAAVATSIAPQDRFVLAPEVRGEGGTFVTTVTDASVGKDAPVQPGLQVVRSPDESEVPETVTRSTDPVYVEEQIAGVPVWIAPTADDQGMRLADWVFEGQRYTLLAERLSSGDSVYGVARGDLAGLVALVIGRS